MTSRPPPPEDDAALESRGAERRRSRASRRWRSSGERFGITALAVALVAGALWLTYQFVEPAPPDTLRIASGSPQGAYHAFANELAREFAVEGITLEIVETEGSIDNLARLDAGAGRHRVRAVGARGRRHVPRVRGARESLLRTVVDLLDARAAPRAHRRPEGAARRRRPGRQRHAPRRAAAPRGERHRARRADARNRSARRTPPTPLLAGDIDAAFAISSAGGALVTSLLGTDGVTLMDFTRSGGLRAPLPLLHEPRAAGRRHRPRARRPGARHLARGRRRDPRRARAPAPGARRPGDAGGRARVLADDAVLEGRALPLARLPRLPARRRGRSILQVRHTVPAALPAVLGGQPDRSPEAARVAAPGALCCRSRACCRRPTAGRSGRRCSAGTRRCSASTCARATTRVRHR